MSPANLPVVIERSGTFYADSRDVAAYFGRQHKHVLEAFRNMHCSDDFRRSNFRPIEIKDLAGTSTSHVEMTKDGFAFLVMGFTGRDAARFKEAYINRFNEMAAELQQRAMGAQQLLANPRAIAAALLAFADTREKLEVVTSENLVLIEDKTRLTAQVEADRPKVAVHDSLLTTDGLINLRSGGKALGLKQSVFIERLETHWLFRENGALMPYQRYIDMGLFRVKSRKIGDKVRSQTYLTGKGHLYFARKLVRQQAS